MCVFYMKYTQNSSIFIQHQAGFVDRCWTGYNKVDFSNRTPDEFVKYGFKCTSIKLLSLTLIKQPMNTVMDIEYFNVLKVDVNIILE